jgi:hypothetical protein
MSFTVRVPLKTQKTNHGIKVLRPFFSFNLGHQTRFQLSQLRVASTWTSDVQYWWWWHIYWTFIVSGCIPMNLQVNSHTILNVEGLSTHYCQHINWSTTCCLQTNSNMKIWKGKKRTKERKRKRKRKRKNSLFEQNLRRFNNHKPKCRSWAISENLDFLNMDGEMERLSIECNSL